MIQKDSERENSMVIGVGHCAQKRSKEREGVEGSWEVGNGNPV